MANKGLSQRTNSDMVDLSVSTAATYHPECWQISIRQFVKLQ